MKEISEKTMGNCLSKESLMADYILSEQRACGWRSGAPLKPVLKCCIEANSSLGFCDVCEENFAYREGPYYPDFRYRSDDELLERISSGMKPFGSIPRHERDLDLEMEITQRGLYLVRVFRSGIVVYHVMKNRDLKLSDVADPAIFLMSRFLTKRYGVSEKSPARFLRD